MKLSLFLATVLLWTGNALAEDALNGDVYTFGDGSAAFTLKQYDQTIYGYDAALQLHDTGEIWALSEHLGVGGAVVFKNDNGRTLLRQGLIGGATVYPVPDSMGIPVWRQSIMVRKSTIADRDEFDMPENDSVEEWGRKYKYSGSVAEIKKPRYAEGIDARLEFENWPVSSQEYRNSLSDHLSAFLEKLPDHDIEKIIVKISDEPNLVHHGDKLTVWVNPALGYAGRLSSEKMLRSIGNRPD